MSLSSSSYIFQKSASRCWNDSENFRCIKIDVVMIESWCFEGFWMMMRLGEFWVKAKDWGVGGWFRMKLDERGKEGCGDEALLVNRAEWRALSDERQGDGEREEYRYGFETKLCSFSSCCTDARNSKALIYHDVRASLVGCIDHLIIVSVLLAVRLTSRGRERLILDCLSKSICLVPSNFNTSHTSIKNHWSWNFRRRI